MKKYILLPVLLIIVLVGIYVAQPFMALNKIKNSYKQRDVAEFSKHIEIESIRKNIRFQIIQAMAISEDPEFLKKSKEEQDMMVSFTEAIMGGFLDLFINPYFVLKSFDSGYEFRMEDGFVSQNQQPEPGQNFNINGFDNLDYKINSLSEILVIINPNNKIELTLKREGLDWKISSVKYPQGFFQKSFDEQKKKREEERLKAEAEAQNLSEENLQGNVDLSNQAQPDAIQQPVKVQAQVKN